MSEIPFQFKNRRSVVSGYVPEVTGLKDGQIFIQQADKEIFFKDADGNLVVINPKSYVTTGQTGSFAGVVIQTGNFVTTGQTGNFVTTSQTGNFGGGINTSEFITTGQTGNFLAKNGDGSSLTGITLTVVADTGKFVLTGQTGQFITTGQTGGFALAANTGNFVTTSQTGIFITSSQTGAFGGGNGASGPLLKADEQASFYCGTPTIVNISSYYASGNLISGSNDSIILKGVSNCLLCSSNSIILNGNYNCSVRACCNIIGGNSNISCYAGENVILGSNLFADGAAQSILFGTDNIITQGSQNFVAGNSNCLFYGNSNIIIGYGNKKNSYNSNIYIIGCNIDISNNDVSNTLYVNNICAWDGVFYGNGAGITGLNTGNFITTNMTGAFITSNQTGSFGASVDTGSFVTTSQTGGFVTTSQTGGFASLNGSNYLCSTQIPNITGDVCIGAGSNISTVYKIQGYPIANTAPITGQTLTFDGFQWVPGAIAAGGNGGGGLVYYFNETVAADLPTGNLPASISGTYELGRSGMLNQFSFESPALPQNNYTGIVGFITDVLDPDITAIPGGLFDFNFWASSNTATQTIVKLEIYKYNGETTTATLLASSDDIYTYDGATTAQYISSIVLPQTTISDTDRLYIRILAKALGNNKKITFYFGGNTPSHVHTTIPSVGGSGLVKVINGIMQNPASYLVDADVSASAAIAGSKIQTNYFALASATGNFVTTSQTGTFAPAAGTGVFALAAASLICNDITLPNSNGGSCGSLIISSRSSTIGALQCGIILNSSFSCICGGSHGSMILGGYRNCTDTNISNSAIIQGCRNLLSASCSIILAGSGITASAPFTAYASNFCVIGGKYYGDGSGLTGVVMNGFCSDINGTSVMIGGVIGNYCGNAITNSANVTMVGGRSNCLYNSVSSAIIGGNSNVLCTQNRSVIIGGVRSSFCVGSSSSDSVILGGVDIVASGGCTAFAKNFCAIGGKYYGDGSALIGISANTTSVSTVTGTGYNISSSDYNNIIRYSGSGLSNSGLFTIPSGISNFTVGGSILIAQVASGQIYFTGAAGTTLLINGSKSKTSAKGATVTFTNTATDEWLINGDIV